MYKIPIYRAPLKTQKIYFYKKLCDELLSRPIKNLFTKNLCAEIFKDSTLSRFFELKKVCKITLCMTVLGFLYIHTIELVASFYEKHDLDDNYQNLDTSYI